MYQQLLLVSKQIETKGLGPHVPKKAFPGGTVLGRQVERTVIGLWTWPKHTAYMMPALTLYSPVGMTRARRRYLCLVRRSLVRKKKKGNSDRRANTHHLTTLSRTKKMATAALHKPSPA